MGGTLPYIKITEVLLENQEASTDVGKYGVAFGFAKRGKPDFPILVRKTSDFEKLFGFPSITYDSKFHYAAKYCLGSGPLICMRIGKDVLSGGLVIMDAGAVGANHALIAGLADPLTYSFAADELLMFSGKFYGDDDNKVAVKITDVDGVAYTFVVQVFYLNSLGTYDKVEEFTVTRKQEVYDGYGKSMYVVDKINNESAYIYCVDNTTELDTVLPKAQASELAMDEGDSGDEPSNSEVVTALDNLSDLNSLGIYTFPDCGYTDTTVQAKIDDICVAAGFGLALLSPPVGDDPADAITHKTSAGISSEFSAYYYPNFTVTDSARGTTGILIPASIAMQKQFLNPLYDYFQVPMGEKFLVTGTPARILSSDEAQTLLDAEINPILSVTGVGSYAVTENTCYPQEGFAQEQSTRILLNYIKWWLNRNFVGFRYERFTTALLQRAEARLGTLVSYLISKSVVSGDSYPICDDTINTQSSDTLSAKLVVYKLGIIKNMDIQVIVAPTGVTVALA